MKKNSDPILQYCLDVQSGREIACRWIKLACARHIRDKERKDIWFDDNAAAWAIGFFLDVLRLNGGQFEGKPFKLEGFEAFIVGSIFGWKFLDGRRRFNTAYVEICKGNGKSPLAAGIGHYGLVADGEMRAEIYAAATKRDQAMILFRDAVAMRDQSPSLRTRLKKSGIGENTWNLADHETASWFRPISSDDDSQSGPRPHFALVDEVHEHKSDVVINMLSAGFKWRRNPLMFMITNSGFDRETVCWRWHEYITKILKRTAENDRVFGFICCLDSCDKHWNEGQEQPVANCPDCDNWAVEGEHWKKANPNLEVSIDWEYLRNQVHKALDMPSEENTVRRLNFGYWTSQSTRWLSMEVWDSCNKPIDFEALKGRSCVVGLDLSVDKDITALVLLFPPDRVPVQEPSPEQINAQNGKEEAREAPIKYMFIDVDALAEDYIIVPYFFMPKDTLLEAERKDRVPYTQWERAGYLYATPGNTVDYGFVRNKLVELNQIYPVKSMFDQKSLITSHFIGYDPWNAREFVKSLAELYSINAIEVIQGHRTLSEPIKQLSRLLKAGKIRHGGHPVLRWMADCVTMREDKNLNVIPDKQKSTGRIDGISALANAFALAIRLSATVNVYEERARAGDGPIVRGV